MSYKSDLPEHLITNKTLGLGRLRVDVAQTSFFAGQQGRTFKEFAIATGQTYTIRVTYPINTVALGSSVEVDAGSIRFSTWRGATESGTWAENLPIFKKNEMTTTPAYSLVTTLTAGGSVTGGTQRDAMRIVAANATAQQTSVGGEIADERGIAAGTITHIKLENIGNSTATGVFNFFWEERP